MLSTISLLVLLCSALLLAGRSYRLGETLQHTAAMVISLAAAFIASAAAVNVLITESNQDTDTLKRLLNNLAFYAAIPLISSALLDIAWKCDWSKAAWGRWLLVLFALFELCRRSEIGVLYSQIMAGLCVLTLLICIIRLTGFTTRIAILGSALFLGAGSLAFSPTSLWVELSNPPINNLCLSAYLLSLIPVIKQNTLSSNQG